VTGYLQDDLPPEEIARQGELYGPFTDTVRDLIDATIRTTVDDDEIRAVHEELGKLTERLRASQIEGSFGVRFSRGQGRPWGNPVVGLRNPVAPPVDVQVDPSGNGDVWADFHLGAAYEGPPGLVHGGVSALILDQVLGHAAGAGGKPGMTGTLTLRYRQGTPLGDLRVEGWIDRVDGIKTYAKAHIIGPDGVTVEADGLMILPRWAREAIANQSGETPSYFE
jgi:acyl-coenzyme A thioesterase PaaI-like protein